MYPGAASCAGTQKGPIVETGPFLLRGQPRPLANSDQGARECDIAGVYKRTPLPQRSHSTCMRSPTGTALARLITTPSGLTKKGNKDQVHRLLCFVAAPVWPRPRNRATAGSSRTRFRRLAHVKPDDRTTLCSECETFRLAIQIAETPRIEERSSSATRREIIEPRNRGRLVTEQIEAAIRTYLEVTEVGRRFWPVSYRGARLRGQRNCGALF
jgi:hypothetical protein